MGISLPTSGASKALTMATLAFAANFSVWILYAVLGLELEGSLGLSVTQLGVLFAAPMLTGALVRIPAGLLADRYNPKHLFTLQMLLVTPALFLLPFIETYNLYLLLGLWIGVSGVSFTLGISYIGDWFERNRQGTAMGVFGAGNAGAAITLVLAPMIIDRWGWDSLGPIYGAGMIAIALLFALIAPSRTDIQQKSLDINNSSPSYVEQGSIFTHLQVWRFGLYYYFVFGSFLALIMWLPQYYTNVYKLTPTRAMAFTLFFAATSSMVRALGGWFADRYGGRTVNWMVFWICLVCLFFLSYPSTTMTIHGARHDVNLHVEVNIWVFTFLIFIIGIAQGFGRASVYKTIHDYYPQQMGAAGGFVAAIGALGGATLPIFFGLAVDYTGFYSVCFMILYGVLAGCMIAMHFANKADRFRTRVSLAQSHNFLEDD